MWVENIPDGGLGRFPAANWEPLMMVRVRLTTRLFPNNVANPQNHIWACRSSLSPCPAPRSAPHQRQLQAERTGSSWTAQSHLRSGKRFVLIFIWRSKACGAEEERGPQDCYLHLCVTGRQRGPCQSPAALPPWGRRRPRSWSKPAGIVVVGRREEGELLFHPQRRHPQRAGQV